ncbi:MAG: dihydrodipicolinate synthase family protein [Thalassobaculales bacterium]
MNTTGHLPKGVACASLTALNADLSVDLPLTLAHNRWLLANGCDAVVILGTTGEANSFTVEERLALIEAVGASDLPKDRMAIGTGCCAIPDTVRLSKAALATGCRSLLLLPPFYYKNIGDDGLYASIAAALDGIADPAMRVYLYHFPALTGVPFTAAVIERLLAAYPGVVVGLKDSSGDGDHMEALQRRFPGFEVFAGTEEHMLRMLRAGGAGTISATVNVTVKATVASYAAWQGPEADARQAVVIAQRQAFAGYPFSSAIKEVMARETGIASWRNVRPPFLPLAADRADALSAKLAAAGFSLPALAQAAQ